MFVRLLESACELLGDAVSDLLTPCGDPLRESVRLGDAETLPVTVCEPDLLTVKGGEASCDEVRVTLVERVGVLLGVALLLGVRLAVRLLDGVVELVLERVDVRDGVYDAEAEICESKQRPVVPCTNRPVLSYDMFCRGSPALHGATVAAEPTASGLDAERHQEGLAPTEKPRFWLMLGLRQVHHAVSKCVRNSSKGQTRTIADLYRHCTPMCQLEIQ